MRHLGRPSPIMLADAIFCRLKRSQTGSENVWQNWEDGSLVAYTVGQIKKGPRIS